MDRPPTRVEWAIDAELHGHSVEQTIRYLSDCADYEDELGARRAFPAGVITVGAVEPRPVAWLRRLLGR